MENKEIKFRFWTGKNMIYSDSYISLYHFFEIISNVDLQQFTGCKDKNGKEIYEGDILGFGQKTKVEVKFTNGAFTIWEEPLGFDYDSISGIYKYDFRYCEVLGNIHENPELLCQ